MDLMLVIKIPGLKVNTNRSEASRMIDNRWKQTVLGTRFEKGGFLSHSGITRPLIRIMDYSMVDEYNSTWVVGWENIIL